jgi:hypothetical protein
MIADVGDIGVELPVLRSVFVKFGEALVYPPPAIMAPPDRAADHPAVNGPPRNDDPPDVPNASPRRSRAGIEIILSVAQRARSHTSNLIVLAKRKPPLGVCSRGGSLRQPAETQFSATQILRLAARSLNFSRLLSLIGAFGVKAGTEKSGLKTQRLKRPIRITALLAVLLQASGRDEAGRSQRSAERGGKCLASAGGSAQSRTLLFRP